MQRVILSVLLLASTPSTTMATETVEGKATYYCSSPDTCTAGYRPGQFIAAIDRKDTPWDKGDTVTVTNVANGRSITVPIVDTCACKDRRIIDLSKAAFAALAPPTLGVIEVVVSTANLALPATDTEDTHEAQAEPGRSALVQSAWHLRGSHGMHARELSGAGTLRHL